MASVDQHPLLQAFHGTGEFGKYQIGVFALSLVASLVSAPVFVDTNLLTYPMMHRCRVPECDGSEAENYYALHSNFSAPREGDEVSSCLSFAAVSQIPSNASAWGGGGPPSPLLWNATCSPGQFNDSTTESCSDGWVYDTSVFHATAVKDFDLVCSRDGLAPLVGSVNMFGILIGSIVAGDLGDRWGRKVGILGSAFAIGVGGTLGALSPNYLCYLGARLLAGAGGAGLFLVTFVIVAECIGSGYRTYCGVLLMIPFAVGEALTGVLAYYIRDWRYLQVAVTAPAFLLISYFWLLPESIRWLVLQKRHSTALEVIKQAAKTNKTSLDHAQLTTQLTDCSSNGGGVSSDSMEKKKQKTVLDLLRHPRMRRRTLNLFFCWAVCTLVYYGLSSISGQLAGNMFLNFIVTMLIEIPSYLITCLVLDRIGRKVTLCSVMIIGGLASFTSGLVPEGHGWVIVGLSLAGKFGISSAFAVVYVYSSEIFPTEYRGVGVGSCSMCARVGGMLAPFVAGLGRHYPPLPLLVFGALSMVSGVLVSFLPETMGCQLPQTLLESEHFASDQRCCEVSCCARHTAPDNSDNEEQGGSHKAYSGSDEEGHCAPSVSLTTSDMTK